MQVFGDTTGRRGRISALAVAIAVLLLGVLGAAPRALAASDESVAYQLDPQHSGDLTDTTLTSSLTEAWSTTLSGPISYPLIADGVVYVTAVAGSGTTLYAIDLGSGATLWSKSLSTTSPWSGIAYDAGRVFALDYDGQLTAFDATTGTTDWTEALPGQTAFSSPPTAANGIVYTGGAGSGGTLYAVAENDGSLLWTQSVENGDNSSPAVDGGSVFVTYPGPEFYAFNATTGASVWRYSSGDEGGGGRTPVVADGMVFARDFTSSNVILDESAGTSDGTFAAGPAPAVGDGLALELSDGTLTAVNDHGTGSSAWTFTGDGDLDTAPLIVGSLVFIGSSSGNLYALNGADGSTAWSGDVGAAIPGPDEQNVSQPLTGLGAGEGTVVVPAGSTLVAYDNSASGVPVNATAPSVPGTPESGMQVAADVGVWSGLPMSYTYQWSLCDGSGMSCSEIGGATSASYTPPAADVGSTLEVTVTAVNGSGSSTSATSAASAQIVLGPPTSLALPQITGTAAPGDVLTASNGTWDGSPTSYSYQWLYCDGVDDCADEPDATGGTYTVDPSDLGYEIEVEVTATNGAGSTTAVSTAQTVTSDGPTNVSAPEISGSPAVGSPLYAAPGIWNGPPTSFAYQWVDCLDSSEDSCASIPGATDQVYTPTSADLGFVLAVVVVGTDSHGESGEVWSNATGAVADAPPPTTSPTPTPAPPASTLANVSPPTVSGVAHVGATDTASPGVWQGLPTYAYQWMTCNAAGAGCAAIPAATGQSYTIIAADEGHTLRVSVTATYAGHTDTVASAATAMVPGTAATATTATTSSVKPHPISPVDAGLQTLAHASHVTPFVKRGLTVGLRASQPGRYTVTLTGDSPVHGRLATATFTLKAKQGMTVTLVPAHEKLLAAAARVTVTLSIEVVTGPTHVGLATQKLVLTH